MDPLKLLSRSTGLRKGKARKEYATPSSGQNVQPQLFPSEDTRSSRKRKRGQDAAMISDDQPRGLDFFGTALKPQAKVEDRSKDNDVAEGSESEDGAEPEETAQPKALVMPTMSDEEIRIILAQHKLKVTLLNPTLSQVRRRRKGKGGGEGKAERPALHPEPLRSFGELRSRFGLSRRLSDNLDEQGYTTPTEVQLGALPMLLDAPEHFLPGLEEAGETMVASKGSMNLLTVAPTGSGKTLAFMIPVLHRIQARRQQNRQAVRKLAAVVLAPTKELASQITNEGRKLAKNSGIRVTQMRRGMQLAVTQSSTPEVATVAEGERTVAKADVLVSTPGLLFSILSDDQHETHDALSDVRDLVLDEADVLLDPLFREQTLRIWHHLRNPSMSVGLWSATMGSNIEELALSTVKDWRERLPTQATEAPFIRLVVGLKDSAVSNVQHKLVYAATEQGKLMGLRQLLHPASTAQGSSAPLLPPFLIFTQTIERAVALHSELLYDIPAEAGGISRIAVLHADLSDTARDSVMTRFRKGEIWVLITTDLLSRGVDFRGVNGVVNYDIPTSSAAYVHRVGRTGRAGREGGVAVTLYSKEDIPYLKHVANVVAMAQKQAGAQSRDDGLQQWLLDALPKLSKGEKQKLKKRGIESRTSRGKEEDPKAARRSRISSKAGFVRQAENNRRGAVLGSQRRAQVEAASDDDAGDETDFGGFDDV